MRWDKIRVAKTLSCSNGANGPGKRFVIWVQGCRLKCPGCCNPDFQDSAGGTIVGSDAVVRKIVEARSRHNITGITLTGGEPLDQARSLSYIVWRFAPNDAGTGHPLSLLLFTGYTEREVGPWQARSDAARLWGMADIVVSGRYDQKLALNPPQGLLASSNQKLYFPTGRLDESALGDLPAGEIIIPKGGKKVIVTGMTPGVLD